MARHRRGSARAGITDESRRHMAANQTAPVSEPATAPPSSALEQVRPGEGHGRRLTAAFEALEGFPALAESRNRLLALVGGHRVPLAEVVETVESDIALVVAVMRVANERARSRRRARRERRRRRAHPHARGRPAARRARAHLRLLRAQRGLGRDARPLPPPRPRHPRGGRAARERDRLPRPRPPDRRAPCCTTSASSC